VQLWPGSPFPLGATYDGVATGQGVVRVLELTGLTRVFEIHASRTAALGAG